jgi:hypothetical protein
MDQMALGKLLFIHTPEDCMNWRRGTMGDVYGDVGKTYRVGTTGFRECGTRGADMATYTKYGP